MLTKIRNGCASFVLLLLVDLLPRWFHACIKLYVIVVVMSQDTFLLFFWFIFFFILHHVGGGQKQSDTDDGSHYLSARKQHGTDSICWIWTVTRTSRLPLVLYKQPHPHTWTLIFFHCLPHLQHSDQTPHTPTRLPPTRITFQVDPQVRQWPDLGPR